MIHYHGLPVSGPREAMARFLSGRHAFVSHASPESLPLAAASARTFALDNGAFSAWKQGRDVDWQGYYDWVGQWRCHPGFDWAVIPDVIDGTARDNDLLLERWPHRQHEGVPVWHLHEPLERLVWLCGAWPRVALGSSGECARVNSAPWKARMALAMDACCGILSGGRPLARLHGLRMLDPRVFTRYPFASCDSTNAARNAGIDKNWSVYAPPDNWQRAAVIAWRVEAHTSPSTWVPDQAESTPPRPDMPEGEIGLFSQNLLF
jgi:hypothetical protein